MSRLYDAAEPGVIDEELLHKLVQEQGPTGEAGRIALSEGVESSEVIELRIDFKNIQQIENLWQFRNLRKLQLDNNIINTITGLDQLIHLEWLDLSFNNLKEIRGLEKLTKLKDVSLAHNLIKHVGGLDTLTELQVLSLGHNQLEDLQGTVLYLHQLPSLETLCLKGNMFSVVPSHEDERMEIEVFRDYQMVCLAFLPNLIYLDYEMITDEARAAACERHDESITELKTKERQEMIKRQQEDEKQKKLLQLKTAYIDGIEDEQLYMSLFEEDNEAKRLALIPGEQERLDKYHDNALLISEEIRAIGLEEEDKRRKEREAFFIALKKALESNQEISVNRIQQYEKEKTQLLAEQQSEVIDQKITELHHELMKLEMLLVDQLDEIIKDFDRNYNEMISLLLEKIQAYMTQLRDYEKDHHETLTEEATKLLEAHSKGQLEEELPDTVRTLFSDKDTLLGALNSSHDTHMLSIDNKEDSIRLRALKDSKILMNDIIEKESSRNRQRITEISQYIDLQREETEY